MTADEKVAWMRSKGVIEARWDGEALMACVLGPEPYQPMEPIEERELTPEEAAAARLDLLLASS